MQGESPKVKVVLEESLAIYRQAGPEYHQDLAYVLSYLGSCEVDAGNLDRGLALTYEAFNLYKECNDRFGMADNLGTIGFHDLEPARKKKAHLEGLANVEAIGDEDGIATALINLGTDAFNEGEYEEASTFFKESYEHFRKVGNPTAMAFLIQLQAECCFYIGDFEQAAQRYDEAKEMRQETGINRGVIYCLMRKCDLALAQGDYAQALKNNEEVLAFFQKTSDPRGFAIAVSQKAKLARLQGDTSQAVQLAQDRLRIGRENGFAAVMLMALEELGKLALLDNDLLKAGALFQESCNYIKITRPMSRTVLIYNQPDPLLFASLASLAVRKQEMERAARLFGMAEHRCRGLANILAPVDRAQYTADLAAARDALGEAHFEQLFQEGKAMTLDQTIDYAMDV